MIFRHAYSKMWLVFYCALRPTVCATAGDRKENCWQVLDEVYAISSTPNLIGPMPLSSSRFRRCACATEFASVGFHAQLPQLGILAPPPSGSMNIFVTYTEISIKSKLYKTNSIVLRNVVIAFLALQNAQKFMTLKLAVAIQIRHYFGPKTIFFVFYFLFPALSCI